MRATRTSRPPGFAGAALAREVGPEPVHLREDDGDSGARDGNSHRYRVSGDGKKTSGMASPAKLKSRLDMLSPSAVRFSAYESPSQASRWFWIWWLIASGRTP